MEILDPEMNLNDSELGSVAEDFDNEEEEHESETKSEADQQDDVVKE